MIEVGKLYRCSEYILLLFPDKEAADVWTQGPSHAYWSKKFDRDKPVSHCNPLTPLLVLSVKEQYIEVLAGDKKGWIINMDWLEIKEIVDAAA